MQWLYGIFNLYCILYLQIYTNNNNNDNLLHARFLGNTDSVVWQNVQDTKSIMKQSSEMREN